MTNPLPVPPGADAPEMSKAPAGVVSRRRHLWLYAGVAAAAAAAGGGWSWWRNQSFAEASDASQAFWDLSFETPAGQPLAAAAFKGKPLLLNFWATWCPPCIAELPLLNGFYRENAAKGWQVMGVAVDQPSAVRGFLERTPLDFPIAMAGLGGTDLSRSLGNLGGGLPFTVLFAADGRILHRKIGQVTPENLRQWSRLI